MTAAKHLVWPHGLASEGFVDVSVRETQDLTILDLSGKILGGPESDPLRAVLDRILERGERRLLVNLSAVPWMNSAGLGVLLSAYARMKDRGGDLRFFGVGERVRGILRTTKLLTVLAVLDDEEAGIRSFRSEGRGPTGTTPGAS